MLFPYPVVDSHAHIFTTDLPMVVDRRYTPGQNATAEMYLAFLQSQDVRYGVLIQPSFLGTDNSFLLEHLSARPERFRGVVVLEPDTPVNVLRDMDRRGVAGLRLNLIGKPLPDLSTTAWDTLLHFVRSHDWHVELQCTSLALPMLIPPLLKRGCRVVVDHFGRPDLTLGLQDPGLRFLLKAAESGRIWVKLSAAYRLGAAPDRDARIAELTTELLKHFGARRLIWATDWPHSEHPEQLRHGRALSEFCRRIADAGEQKQILSDTPLELFKFEV